MKEQLSKESMREIRITLGWALISLSCLWYLLLTFAVPDLQEMMLSYGFTKVDEYQARLVLVVIIIGIVALKMNNNWELRLGLFECLGGYMSTVMMMTFLIFVHSFAVFLFLVLGVMLIVLLRVYAKSAVDVSVGLYIGMYSILSLVYFIFLGMNMKSMFEMIYPLIIMVSIGIVFAVFELLYGVGVKDKQRFSKSKKCTDILAVCCFCSALLLYLQFGFEKFNEFYFTKLLLAWLCLRCLFSVLILYTKRYRKQKKTELMQTTKENAPCKL